MGDEARGSLNRVYFRLEQKRAELTRALAQQALEWTSGYYNGHYSRREDGSFQMDYYPIPVVTVKGCCDVEIALDGLSISTKLERGAALSYDYGRLPAGSFEVYGVEDYLSDYYRPGMDLEKLPRTLEASHEREIGFSFSFDFDTAGETVSAFVKRLREDGFYY